ncbi:unnamed protein product, partial [Linum tenue]
RLPLLRPPPISGFLPIPSPILIPRSCFKFHFNEVTNPFGSGGQQQRHFYLAVDRLQFKMEMLVDLLGVAGRRSGIPMAVCCSSRDELDAVCSAVSNLPDISLASLYSDLAESERTLVLETFRQATIKWAESAMTSVQFGDDGENQNNENKSQMIVVTDACLPGVLSGESSIAARILINYELPTKKVFFLTPRLRALSADGIVINVVAGGEVVTLKNVEESCGLLIAEMPINVSCVLHYFEPLMEQILLRNSTLKFGI